MSFEATPVRVPAPGSGHIAQLFDDDDSLAATVGAYLADGWHDGDSLLVVTTTRHWSMIQRVMAARGVAITAAIGSGRLVVRDARRTLSLLYRHQRVDRVQFDACIADLVRTLAARGAPVRIFGEVVDLLAGAGDFEGAERLEGFWNELGRRQPFRLLCAYAAATFGDPVSGSALRRICGAHVSTSAGPGDPLGAFLVDRALAR